VTPEGHFPQELCCAKLWQNFDRHIVSPVSSTEENIHCDKLLIVVGRRLTDDVDLFITPTTRLCVQHDAREAARRADTCFPGIVMREFHASVVG